MFDVTCLVPYEVFDVTGIVQGIAMFFFGVYSIMIRCVILCTCPSQPFPGKLFGELHCCKVQFYFLSLFPFLLCVPVNVFGWLSDGVSAIQRGRVTATQPLVQVRVTRLKLAANSRVAVFCTYIGGALNKFRVYLDKWGRL